MKNIPEDICQFVVVRHGQTEFNQSGTLQGQLNTQLDALGRCQAQAVAERLRKRHFDAAYSSDLDRAQETARTILQYHPELTLNLAPQLREWLLGAWQGRRLADIIQEVPNALSAFREDTPDVTVPDGETIQEFQQRVSSFINGIAEKSAGRNILLVTHGGAMQRMLRHCTGPIAAPNVRPFCNNASIAVFRYKKPGVWQLVTWNDTAHLENIEQNDLLPL